MDEDKFIDYQADNYNELLEKFVESNLVIKQQFDDYCMQQFAESGVDEDEYAYEKARDDREEELNNMRQEAEHEEKITQENMSKDEALE